MVPLFEYHRVQSPEEAVQALVAYPGEAKILAGGTDLLLRMQRGQEFVKHLISMRDIETLGYLSGRDGWIALGAKATHRQVEVSPLIRKELGALHDAACRIGSVQVRNVGTVAGNLCTAVPSADTAAPLLALDGAVKVTGPRGQRLIALKDFFRGVRSTAINPDELLLEIQVPRPPAFSGSSYFKLSRRKAMDLALIGVAAYVRTSPDRERFAEARIALSTVAPTPIRAYAAEKMLADVPVKGENLREASVQASREALPRTSFRATAEYRREMIEVFVRRALEKALERLRET